MQTEYKIVTAKPGAVLLNCDARRLPLPDKSIQCCVTSPPYWGLRDYGVAGQLGLEKTPEEYVANMVQVFREVRRVLKDDGVLWLNLGDSFWNSNGFARAEAKWQRKGRNDAPANDRKLPPHPVLKIKDLVGIPWRVAFALQSDGWYLRSDIIWAKPNPMPESVTDRPTKSHEYIFLMSKSEKYYYDSDAVKEPAVSPPKSGGKNNGLDHPKTPKANKKQDALGKPTYTGFNERYKDAPPSDLRNRRTVWNIATQSYTGSHFATFPEEIPRVCIAAGSRPGDIILDPFGGSGTTGQIALSLGRKIVHVDLNYHDLAIQRMGLNAN
jgi:DNA modification methylase